MEKLTSKAIQTYKNNFKDIAWFGRCIFLSWYCDVGTCDFCFRSTQKHKIKHAKTAKRTIESIMTDAILGKFLDFRIEFLTGGYRIFSFAEIFDIIKQVSHIYKEKIWINLGTLKKEELKTLKPYVQGICASIETIEPVLHDKICPDKPIEPYTKMLKLASELGFKKSITIVLGLGEKKKDFKILKEYIKENDLDRITFYALKPVKGTPYTKSPEIDYYSWWIKKTRVAFPRLEIIAGLTPKHPEYAKDILISGANAITKFPVIKKFNTLDTRLIEKQINDAKRKFISNLSNIPDIDKIRKYIDSLDDKLFSKKLKENIKYKIEEYIFSMSKNE